jgi:hypothetical protein
MPVVSIRYKAKIKQTELAPLVPVLREVLARQLTCENNQGQPITITHEMVKLRFDQASELDTGMHDLHIEIEARNFEARKPHLEEYSTELAQAVASLLPQDIDISIWYKLCHASWRAQPGQLPATARDDS